MMTKMTTVVLMAKNNDDGVEDVGCTHNHRQGRCTIGCTHGEQQRG